MNDVRVVPGGRWLIVETTGHNAKVHVYDRDLALQGSCGQRWQMLVPQVDGTELLALGAGDVDILGLPNLNVTSRFEHPRGVAAFWPRGLHAMLGSLGAVVVTSSGPGNVARLPAKPLSVGGEGSTSLERVRGSAFDPQTGLLVLIGKPRSLELFDPVEMRTLCVKQLPCRGVTFDVWAANGVAWIGAKDGRVLRFDIERRCVETAFEVADGGEISLRGCEASRYLAVASVGPLREGYPTSLHVFDVSDGGHMDEVASTDLKLGFALNDIAIHSGRRFVILATGETLVWDYGQAAPQP